MDDILKKINWVYKESLLTYLCSKYIDINYWIKPLKAYFPNNFIHNNTDFNYSKCFTIWVYLSDLNFDVLSKEFSEYMKKSDGVFILEIKISVIAPYAMFKFLRYFIDDNQQTQMVSSGKSFNKEHLLYEDTVQKFINENQLTLLDDTILKTEVLGITLELQEGIPSVYNCLFDDCASLFPYNE